jgi:RsiW-degrading membrane proteinase PrsW (M82 family)
MKRLVVLAIAGSVGFWINESLHYAYNRVLHAPPRRRRLADVVTITEGRFHR